MSGLINEIVRVDVKNITTLEEIKNISKWDIAVFSDREELVIKNDKGEKHLKKYVHITTICNGDLNGIKETSYFCKTEGPFNEFTDYMINNYQKSHDKFDEYDRMLKKAGLK